MCWLNQTLNWPIQPERWLTSSKSSISWTGFPGRASSRSSSLISASTLATFRPMECRTLRINRSSISCSRWSTRKEDFQSLRKSDSLNIQNRNFREYELNFWKKGCCTAFLLLSQQPWDQFSGSPKVNFIVAEIFRRCWLGESWQRLENVDRTHLVLAFGRTLLRITFSFLAFSWWEAGSNLRPQIICYHHPTIKFLMKCYWCFKEGSKTELFQKFTLWMFTESRMDLWIRDFHFILKLL